MLSVNFNASRVIDGSSAGVDIPVPGVSERTDAHPFIVTQVEDRDAVVRVTVPGYTDTLAVLESNPQWFYEPVGDGVLEGNEVRSKTACTRVIVTTPKGKRLLPINAKREYESGGTLREFISHAEGSLAKHITDAILSMCEGKTPGDATQLRYTSAVYSDVGCTATPNPNLFCASLNFDATPIYRHTSGPQASPPYVFTPHLISPRHIIASTHVGSWVGMHVYFRRADGSTHHAQVTAIQDLGGDMQIGLLDADVTGVVPYATLPAGWEKRLPSGESGAMGRFGGMVPMIFKGTRRVNGGYGTDPSNRFKLVFGNFGVNNGTGNPLGSMAALKDWWNGIDGGDSGGASFVPIYGEAVLVQLQWTAMGGPQIATRRAEIDAAMNAIAGAPSGTYAMRTVNISGFRTF